jgi:hypothetical protein
VIGWTYARVKKFFNHAKGDAAFMAELKTKPTTESVEKFLNKISDETLRQDCLELKALMTEVTQFEPTMWGASMIGFGKYHYKYASGHEGDSFIVGFAPRKRNLVLYLSGGLDAHADLLAKLGKHKAGKGCLYVNRMRDVDVKILRTLLERCAVKFPEAGN